MYINKLNFPNSRTITESSEINSSLGQMSRVAIDFFICFALLHTKYIAMSSLNFVQMCVVDICACV